MSDYQNRPEWKTKTNEEVFKSLDPFKKELCKRYLNSFCAFVCVLSLSASVSCLCLLFFAVFVC